MRRRLLISVALVLAAAGLSACVVVPAYPGYGYGYRHYSGEVVVFPPPVVVYPTPSPYRRHGG